MSHVFQERCGINTHLFCNGGRFSRYFSIRASAKMLGSELIKALRLYVENEEASDGKSEKLIGKSVQNFSFHPFKGDCDLIFAWVPLKKQIQICIFINSRFELNPFTSRAKNGHFMLFFPAKLKRKRLKINTFCLVWRPWSIHTCKRH